jgi:hypothetical protein
VLLHINPPPISFLIALLMTIEQIRKIVGE